MKVSTLPQQAAADGTEEMVVVTGPANARVTKRMAANLLAAAATKPTPDDLKAAILGALVAGQNITFTQNPDGTVGVAVSDNADLTGAPKAPTAAPGTNTRQIATTAFVDAVRAALTTAIGGKQATLVAGANIDLHANGDGTFTIASTAAGGGTLTDGVYGDVTVSGGGTVLTVTKVTNGTVTVPDEAYGAAWQTKLSVPTKNAVYNQIESVKSSKVSTTAVGVANGVASLDATGKVPAGQLPSYVDDVLEFSSSSAFPNPGETGKIYVALDTNAQWRWSGTAYVQLIASPGTTDNVVEGSTNKYYTDVRVRAAVMTGLVSTAGTPVGTDSLLTVLGKLYRQAFTQVLPLAGGTITGAVTVSANLSLDVAAGVQRNFSFSRAGLSRWNFAMDGSPETGGNANGDFYIQRFTDAGAFIDNPFNINRSTGNATFAQNVAITGAITVHGGVISDTFNSTGIYKFADGSKYLNYDATKFNLSGGDLWPAQGSAIKINHSHQADGNDGYIVAGRFAPGLNIIGNDTDGSGRRIAMWGTLQCMDGGGGTIHYSGDGRPGGKHTISANAPSGGLNGDVWYQV